MYEAPLKPGAATDRIAEHWSGCPITYDINFKRRQMA